MKNDKKLIIDLYQTMVRVRYLEDKLKDLYLRGYIRGTIHVSQGQEAVAAGGCLALEPDDYIITTHRGHGHCLAKGVGSRELIAEILGKETGCCKGRGGSLHAFDVSKGVLGAAAVVGAGIPIATGVGLGIRQLKEKKVILSFFGDGASNQGTFHEAINLGSVWKLPVVYLVENNQVADTTPYNETINIENIADRAKSYGIPGVVVDGNDVLAVYKAVKKAAERARSGQGPTLIECKTYRWEGHHIGDSCVWRKDSELEAWKEQGPIKRLAKKILTEHILSEDELNNIKKDVKNEMEEAAKFAIDSPQPDSATALNYVWADNEEEEVL